MAHLLNLMLMLLSNNFFFLGAGGTMRLASDCAQLEFALSSILGPTGTRDILVLSENLVLNCVFYVPVLLWLSPNPHALASCGPYITNAKNCLKLTSGEVWST